MSKECWITDIRFICHTENDGAAYLRDRDECAYTLSLQQVLDNSRLTRDLISKLEQAGLRLVPDTAPDSPADTRPDS